MITSTTARLIEQGNGFTGCDVGAEVYDGEDLVVITSCLGCVYTDDSRGNYVVVEVEPADRSVLELSDAEFAELPQVRVEVQS